MSERTEGGRTPPRSEEAERAVLGALLLDPDRFADVAEVLAEEDFHDRRHAAVFACLESLYERNVPVDFVSVGEGLRALGKFEEIVGSSRVDLQACKLEYSIVSPK